MIFYFLDHYKLKIYKLNHRGWIIFFLQFYFIHIVKYYYIIEFNLYFKNFDPVIFYHAAYLFFLILTRDIIKDLENFKGDWVQRYKTLPVVFDHKTTKAIITICIVFTFIPSYFIIQQPLGSIHNFYWASFPFLSFVLIFLWRAQTEKAYLWTHNFIKLWILIGVLSIALIFR